MTDINSKDAKATAPFGSDRELLFRWMESADESAAAEIYERYIDRLLNCLREKASPAQFSGESVAQSAFKSFFIKARARRFQFDTDQDLWKLLVTIALCKKRMRIRKKRETSGVEDIDSGAPRIRDEPAPDDVAAYLDLRAALDARLNERERQYLRLRELGLKQDEIGAEMGITPRQVRRLRTSVETKAWIFFENN